MPEINLTRLANGRGYCSDPAQPIIANDYAASDITAGIETSISPLQNDDYLASIGASITGVSSLSNCTATADGQSILVTGSAAGAGSLDYTAEDGNGNSDTATVTFTVVANESWDSVEIADDTNPDIPGVTTGQIVNYETTTSEGTTVSINEYGHIEWDDQPVAGESFDYNINGGATQTYTVTE